MNFLAHAYLSFDQPGLLVGNLITDFIRGYPKKKLPSPIQKGIKLHHAIDKYTDHHPATLSAKKYLYPSSGRYWGVFLDVIYDHFLATDSSRFSLEGLATFSTKVYQTLDTYEKYLPPRFKRIYPYMKRQDWLYSYHSKRGIYSAFKGIYHRANYLEESDVAYKAFIAHYQELQQCYLKFMPEMIIFSKAFIDEIKGTSSQ